MAKKQYLRYRQKISTNLKKWSHKFKNNYELKLDKLNKIKHNKSNCWKPKANKILNEVKNKKTLYLQNSNNKLTYSTETIKDGRRKSSAFKVLKVNNCRGRILHPEKISSENKAKINCHFNKNRKNSSQGDLHERKCWRAFSR